MDPFTLAVVGAAYGTSVAVGMSRRGTGPDRWLAAFLACGVTAILTIVLQHRAASASMIGALERLEYVATLASGPVLQFYVHSAGGGALNRRSLLHFLPAIVAAVVPGVLDVPIELLVTHQATYTVLAAVRWAKAKPASRSDSRITFVMIVLMAVIHLAQLLRIAASSSPALVDLIPITISVGILCAGVAGTAMWMVRSSVAESVVVARGGVAAPKRTRTDTPSGPGADDLLMRLERLMNEQHIYRRSDLGLHDLATSLEVTPHELSAALNDVAGTSLLELLARYRLEDAKRRLLDPEHDIYTIEGIGEMSGFGSRSAFYAIFRRELETTPSRFRSSGSS